MLITNIVEDRDAIFFTIENYGAIALAYGAEVANAVASSVSNTFYALSDGRSELCCFSPGVYTLSFHDGDQGPDRLALEEICVLISAIPFNVDGSNVMAVVSVHEHLEGAQIACLQHTEVMSAEWLTGYRRDMSLGAQFIKGTDSGAFATLWRPVRGARSQKEVLHYEAVPRMFDRNGASRDCDGARDALARIGLGWIYDLANLMSVIDELYSDPLPSISVQISPRSLVHDGGACCARWLPALRRLSASPDVATRLVIEVSGPTDGISVDSMKEHISSFRRLGVKLSFANFGSSDLNVEALIALAPDIVKLSPAFMHGASLNPSHCRRLQLLFRLAGTIANTVVLEGVDAERHLQIAGALGSRWVKGRAVGEPAFGRHWKIVHSFSDSEYDQSAQFTGELGSELRQFVS